MSRTVLAVTAGLSAAFAYGVASAVQHDQAGRVAKGNPLNPNLIGRLAKRPVWLLGMVADISAVALQTVALRYGAVILVQLLVVSGLPVAVVLSAWFARVPLGRSELYGLLLCTGGLAVAVPGITAVNLGHPAGRGAWLLVSAVVVAVAVGLVDISRRRPRLAPAAIGVAAGVTAGASSILLAICAARIDHPLALLRTISPYAALGLGLATLLLSQAAFQTGTLGTPLAALSVTEPLVAVLLAATVLHEHLPARPVVLATSVLGAGAAVVGVLVLSRSARLGRVVNAGDPPEALSGKPSPRRT